MYATLSELISQYGLTEMVQLLDDEEGNLSADLLTAVIDDDDTSDWSADEIAAAVRSVSRAESIIEQTGRVIDASLATRYPVPLTDDQAHATAVNTCCMALARCSLADDGDNISDSMKDDRSHWRGWLRDVQSGKVVLPGVPSVSAGDGNIQRRLTAKPRTRIADYRLGCGWRQGDL